MAAEQSGPDDSGCPGPTRRLLVAVLAGIAAVLLAPASADADRVTPRRAAGVTYDWGHRPRTPYPARPTAVPGLVRPPVAVPTPTAGPPSEGPEPTPKPRPSPDDPPSAKPPGSHPPDAVSPRPSHTTKPSHTAKPSDAAGSEPRAAEHRHKPVHAGGDAVAADAVEAPYEPAVDAPTRPTAVAAPPPTTPRTSPADRADGLPADQATPSQGRAASDRLVGRQSSLGDDFHRSMIYSGVIGLALAFIGMAMVAWRRRFW